MSPRLLLAVTVVGAVFPAWASSQELGIPEIEPPRAPVFPLDGVTTPANGNGLGSAAPATPQSAIPAAPLSAAYGRSPCCHGEGHESKGKSLTLVNGRQEPLENVTVTANGNVELRSGPLAPNAKTVLKLPPLKSCTVEVAVVEAGVPSAVDEFDACKLNVVRLVD